MAIDTINLRSRRVFLSGLAGGLAAAVAGSLGRAQPVAAGTSYVVLGDANTSGGVTSITNSATDGSAFAGTGNGGGYGVFGSSSSAQGVYGSSSSGTGVTGLSSSGTGVYGQSYSGSRAAVLGKSNAGNTGLQGHSGTTDPPASPAKTGVYGYAAQDDSARGVTGETTAGRGVNGIATSGSGVVGHTDSGFGVEGVAASGYGVSGTSASNFGVYAYSDSSVAMYAEAPASIALQTVGRVKLDTSGIAMIPAGSTSVTVSPPFGVDVNVGSFVLLTPMANIGTRALWFTKNTALDTITIHLSSSRTSATKVSWLLLG